MSGKTTNFEAQSHRQVKYPRKIVALTIVLCCVVLIASFLPSAFRLHVAGTSTFCESIVSDPNQRAIENAESAESILQGREIADADGGTGGNTFGDIRCQIAGYSMILLSEIGLIVFFLSLPVLTDGTSKTAGTRRILYFGILASSVIAIAGNLHITEPWNHGYFFAWLEAILPPILVMLSLIHI